MQSIVRIISGFQPTSLSEMDGVRLMNRVDTKFAFSLEKLQEILPLLDEHYKVLEIDGVRIPAYESLYFDDADFSFYKDHHNGKTDRFKVRIRKYVESELFFLEVKHKKKGRTDKKRVPVEGFCNDLDPSQRIFLEKHIRGEHDLRPNLWNSFRRITLVRNETRERLTLDFQLKFYWEEETCSFDNLVIAELKQESLNRSSVFYGLMKQRQIRPYRLSKYCIGSIELYGRDRIKYNRFKEKLIKLKSINAHVA